jgi:hypothetical protein
VRHKEPNRSLWPRSAQPLKRRLIACGLEGLDWGIRLIVHGAAASYGPQPRISERVGRVLTYTLLPLTITGQYSRTVSSLSKVARNDGSSIARRIARRRIICIFDTYSRPVALSS